MSSHEEDSISSDMTLLPPKKESQYSIHLVDNKENEESSDDEPLATIANCDK
jgi:hypothetical protein